MSQTPESHALVGPERTVDVASAHCNCADKGRSFTARYTQLPRRRVANPPELPSHWRLRHGFSSQARSFQRSSFKVPGTPQ